MYFCMRASSRAFGRIALQEHFRQPQRAQRFGERFHQPPAFAQDQLRAPAADVHHQHPLLGMRPHALHSQMNQAGFFQPRNDFHRMPDDGRRPRQKFIAIRGIPQGRRSHRAHAHHIQLAVLLRHAPQDLARQLDFRRRQLPLPEYRLPQTHHLPIRRQHLHAVARSCTSAASMRMELLPISIAA